MRMTEFHSNRKGLRVMKLARVEEGERGVYVLYIVAILVLFIDDFSPV